MAVPRRVLEVTTNIGCRLLCSYCPQPTVTRAYRLTSRSELTGAAVTRTMSARSLEQYLESVPASVDVHFSGFSEPWHAAECVDMITLAHRRGHRVAVFTTADAMAVGDVSRIADIPFKKFLVHLPDRHREMRKDVGAEYVSVLRALDAAPVRNLEFFTIGVPHPVLVDEIGAAPSTGRIHSRAGNVSFSSARIAPTVSSSEIEARNSGTSLICRKDRIFANVLLPNGSVYLCSMDYGLEHELGNLRTQSYAEIVNGPRFARILALLNDPDSDVLCRRCEYALPGRYQLHGT